MVFDLKEELEIELQEYFINLLVNNGYEYVIQFDGDGQHIAKEAEKLLNKMKETEADIVIGSRFIDDASSDFKSSKARRAGINIISFFIKLVTKKKIYDTTSGFRAINRELIRKFSLSYPVEYPEPVSTTETLKCGYRVEEVAVSMNEREAGVSSIRAWKSVYYMINVVLSLLLAGIRKKKK